MPIWELYPCLVGLVLGMVRSLHVAHCKAKLLISLVIGSDQRFQVIYCNASLVDSPVWEVI